MVVALMLLIVALGSRFQLVGGETILLEFGFQKSSGSYTNMLCPPIPRSLQFKIDSPRTPAVVEASDFPSSKMTATTASAQPRMDTTEDVSMSDETHAFPDEQPQLPSLSAVEASSRIEYRRIRCPPHRYTPLREHWEQILTPLVEYLQLQVRVIVVDLCMCGHAMVQRMIPRFPTKGVVLFQELQTLREASSPQDEHVWRKSQSDAPK